MGGESDVTPLARNCPRIHCCRSYSVNFSFRAHAARRFGKRRLRNPVDGAARRAMRFELLRRPGRFKLLHQVRRTHHLAALRANQLHGPGIHQRHVRNQVLRRILHRHFFRAPDQLLQILFQFLRGRVEHLSPGSESSVAASIRCTSFRGAPFAGIM